MIRDRKPAELDKLAKDIHAGKVFCGFHIPPTRKIEEVFLPLAFIREDLLDQITQKCSVIYAYNDQAKPIGINNQPVFFKCDFLTNSDSEKLVTRLKILTKKSPASLPVPGIMQ